MTTVCDSMCPFIHTPPRQARVGDIDVPQTRSARYTGPEKVANLMLSVKDGWPCVVHDEHVGCTVSGRLAALLSLPPYIVEPYSPHKAEGYAPFRVKFLLCLDEAILAQWLSGIETDMNFNLLIEGPAHHKQVCYGPVSLLAPHTTFLYSNRH